MLAKTLVDYFGGRKVDFLATIMVLALPLTLGTSLAFLRHSGHCLAARELRLNGVPHLRHLITRLVLGPIQLVTSKPLLLMLILLIALQVHGPILLLLLLLWLPPWIGYDTNRQCRL